jgi:hypothetical protein
VSDYFETIPALRDIYLEDSYVLAIHESEGELRIDLDAVLTENHPQWTPPKPDEHYCFRRIRLIFERPRRVEWIRKDMRPSRDATGEIDYGNIWSIQRDGTVYEVEGDLGQLRVDSGPPIVIDHEE